VNHRHPSSSLTKNVRKRSQRKAAEMASREIDRLADQTATGEEQAQRKRHLIKGPREFRDMRGDLPKRSYEDKE
jgi:hypothetical protein